jgi:hypothetical protein
MSPDVPPALVCYDARRSARKWLNLGRNRHRKFRRKNLCADLRLNFDTAFYMKKSRWLPEPRAARDAASPLR